MEMQAVSSSFIRSVGFEPDQDDASEGTTTIQFLDGAVFQYSGVSLADYQMLLNAPSVGKAFHQWWKRKYSGVRS